MRTKVFGGLAATVLIGWTCWAAFAQSVPPVGSASASSGASGLITHVHAPEGKPITVIVVDPVQKVMAVYHVVQETGEIKPKSIRSLQFDLRLREFNSPDLPPDTIEKRLERGN